MRKLIPFLFSGLAALSFRRVARRQRGQCDNAPHDRSAPTGADAKGDANRGATTASDNAISEKRDDVEGTAKDSHQANPKPGKQAKQKKGPVGRRRDRHRAQVLG
jgi:hypothetical protein